MSGPVYIFNPYAAEPVYHTYGDTTESADVTKCGLVMYDTETRYAAKLRRDQADLFARPCHRCFDEPQS